MAVVDGNAVVWYHGGTVVVAVFRVPGKKKKILGVVAVAATGRSY